MLGGVLNSLLQPFPRLQYMLPLHSCHCSNLIATLPPGLDILGVNWKLLQSLPCAILRLCFSDVLVFSFFFMGNSEFQCII